MTIEENGEKVILAEKKSGGGGWPTQPDFSRSGRKVKKFVGSQIWPHQTDPLKGQLFAKKGVK
jgi:hypothetical protein